MENKQKVINDLLVDIFNDILIIEQKTISYGEYKDISVTEIHTIEAIGISNLKSMSEIAAELNITVGTLTTAINNLVKKGYVERQKSESDRRVVKISLTKKGKLVHRLHEMFHCDMVMSSIQGLTEHEIDVLVRSLDKLNNFFRDKYKISK
ncbi:MarR family winged helix-turn-helix transcriptional regulator [Clostridium cylindrosporum]|nr:MarR family transcriptional regulator [Clostridium cylindrosporum]